MISLVVIGGSTKTYRISNQKQHQQPKKKHEIIVISLE